MCDNAHAHVLIPRMEVSNTYQSIMVISEMVEVVLSTVYTCTAPFSVFSLAKNSQPRT